MCPASVGYAPPLSDTPASVGYLMTAPRGHLVGQCAPPPLSSPAAASWPIKPNHTPQPWNQTQTMSK
eukprot:364328-Chlamydomonas_euryale.AAC.10